MGELKRPARITHNNPNYPIAYSEDIRGGMLVVTTLPDLYTQFVGKENKLQERATRCHVISEDADYMLVDINNLNNPSGWEKILGTQGQGWKVEEITQPQTGYNNYLLTDSDNQKYLKTSVNIFIGWHDNSTHAPIQFTEDFSCYITSDRDLDITLSKNYNKNFDINGHTTPQVHQDSSKYKVKLIQNTVALILYNKDTDELIIRYSDDEIIHSIIQQNVNFFNGLQSWHNKIVDMSTEYIVDSTYNEKFILTSDGTQLSFYMPQSNNGTILEHYGDHFHTFIQNKTPKSAGGYTELFFPKKANINNAVVILDGIIKNNNNDVIVKIHGGEEATVTINENSGIINIITTKVGNDITTIWEWFDLEATTGLKPLPPMAKGEGKVIRIINKKGLIDPNGWATIGGINGIRVQNNTLLICIESTNGGNYADEGYKYAIVKQDPVRNRVENYGSFAQLPSVIDVEPGVFYVTTDNNHWYYYDTTQSAYQQIGEAIEGMLLDQETFQEPNYNIVTPDNTHIYYDTPNQIYYRWDGVKFIEFTQGGGGVCCDEETFPGLLSIQEGDNININYTDPKNPVISANAEITGAVEWSGINGKEF